jgi:hypothetical protein
MLLGQDKRSNHEKHEKHESNHVNPVILSKNQFLSAPSAYSAVNSNLSIDDYEHYIF